MVCQPTLHRWRLVGGSGVEYDVAVQIWGDFCVDLLEERQEFLAAVAGVQGPDDLPNSGSLVSFHESCLWGANPNARHTRETID